MNKFFLTFILPAVLFLPGCWVIGSMLLPPAPDIYIKEEFKPQGLAVLTFVQSGKSLPKHTGKLTANKLSDALFLQNGYSIIDRSQVNDAQYEMEIRNTEFISTDKVQQIGLKLKANYLILGRVELSDINNFNSFESGEELKVSFRIISVSNMQVYGMVRYHKKISSDNIPEEVDDIVDELVFAMKQNEPEY